MAVNAGSILTVGGANVVDRLQSAGLGDVQIPLETIRETGNRLVVDKVPGEADFTFTMQSLDVSTDMMAFLNGKVGASASGSAPGASDPSGTTYPWDDCEFVNIVSPWKDETTGSAGTIEAGVLIPGYYPTRLRYNFGTGDNATQEVELSGGEFYQAKATPVEEYATGNGASATFTTLEDVYPVQIGTGDSEYKEFIFGVIVDGVLQIENTDYTIDATAGDPADIIFAEAPASQARIRYTYFTDAAHAYPQSVHADNVTKPGAVRGRDIEVWLTGSGGTSARVASVQSVELEATVEGEVEREMGSSKIVGRSITGIDTTGSITVRSKNPDHFFNLLETVTGIETSTHGIGFFNLQGNELVIKIRNPKSPTEVIKSLVVGDAQFQPPGTPAEVNSPTEFSLSWASKEGTFAEYKGDYYPA